MIKRQTIFSKLFISYLIIIIISLLLFIGIFFYLFHIQIYKSYENTYEHEYKKIEQQLSNENKSNWTEVENHDFLQYALNHADYQIYLIDEKAQHIIEIASHQRTLLADIPPDMMDRITAGERVSKGGFMNGELRYVVSAPLFSVHGDSEILMIMVFHALTHEYMQVIWMILLTFTIAMLFSGIILWFMSKRMTKPLREMNETAIHYAKGDFSKAVQYDSNDEIGQLAKSFTHMAEELNNLESKRKEFVSNVSHDLRSPLTSIKGFLIAMLDGAIPDDRRNHYYGLMKDETERMIKLVNDTLEMTQLEEGNQPVSFKTYNLTKQIERIIHKFEPQIEKKNLEFRFSSEASIDVYADEAKMEQVLINLLQNAIQFSHEDAPIYIQLQTSRQYVTVSIQDFGVGIDQEQLQLIWKRFYKTDEARTNKSGFGLGLSIVKSILDLHGSEVEVKSNLGEGTTFSFTLPLKESP